MKTLLILFVMLFSMNQAVANETSHRQAAMNLLNAMDMEKTMLSTIEKMVDMQIQNNPQLSLFKEGMLNFFKKYMTGKTMYEDFSTMYMEEFTESELKDMTKFYQTPTGKKAIRKMPILTQKGAMWGQKQVMEHMAEFQKMLKEETAKLQELKQPPTE